MLNTLTHTYYVVIVNISTSQNRTVASVKRSGNGERRRSCRIWVEFELKCAARAKWDSKINKFNRIIIRVVCIVFMVMPDCRRHASVSRKKRKKICAISCEKFRQTVFFSSVRLNHIFCWCFVRFGPVQTGILFSCIAKIRANLWIWCRRNYGSALGRQCHTYTRPKCIREWWNNCLAGRVVWFSVSPPPTTAESHIVRSACMPNIR